MNNLKGKRLLLLGSNVWRDIIKRFADNYGITLLFAGNNPGHLSEIVDEVYTVDSINHDAMKEFIKTHSVDGVYMGGSELVISHACQYLNELGLPCYCTKDQWDYLQDKGQFKELCIKNGLPVVPRYIIDPNNIQGSVPTEAYPVITKPTDGSGSNGFSVCHNPEELERGYQIAAENSYSGEVICEKFVNNKGLVAFYSFSNGEMRYALTEDKYPVRYEKQGSYVAGLFLCESRFKDEFRNRYEEKIAAMFKSIGIKEGTIWIEIFHEGDEYYFNEVGYRYGGSFSFYSVDYITRINQVYADLYYATTGESKLDDFNSLIPDSVERGKQYCIYPVHCLPGTIKKITGLEDVRSLSNVVIVPQQHEEGDVIADTGSFGQVVCLVHFTYEKLSDCKDTIDRIHKSLQALDEDGNNLLVKKINWEDVIPS